MYHRVDLDCVENKAEVQHTTASKDDGCEGWHQPLEEGGRKHDAESPQGIIFFCKVVES